jgi:hypothetical protein
MTSRKSLLAVAACAAALAGCAAGPYTYDDDPYYYYDRTGYNDYPVYRYYGYGPGYYAYSGPPVVAFGLSYSNRRHWR